MNPPSPTSANKLTVTTPTTPFIMEPFPIQVLCNFINPYKGERETLPAFLTNCQNALDLASENQKALLLKFILSKLEGKVQIACSNKIFEKFSDLKSFLKQNFGETKHYNHLLFDLQNCKQQNNESVSQFALKVETCLTALQSEIHNSESLKKDLPGRIAMTEDLALFTFTLGLSPRLSTIVRCREPKNLNAAINVALQEEKIQNLFFQNFKKKTLQSSTSSQGLHSQQASSKFQQFSPKTPQQSSSKPSSNVPVCSYCKNKGHHITQCRKRQYNNSQKNKTDTVEQNKHVEIDDGVGEIETFPCEMFDLYESSSNENLN